MLTKCLLWNPKGIRPLAIGHTIRRFVSRCACHTMKEKFEAFFSPVQLGVGVKGGAETIVHAVELRF